MKDSLFAFLLLLAIAAHAAPPANDDFASAQLLTGKSGHIVLDISEATEEPGESFGFETTVWYRVSIPAGKTLVLDTFGSDFDTVLEVGQGSSAAEFSTYDFSDDEADTAQSRLLVRSYQHSGSEHFHIRAQGSGSDTGELHLNYLLFDGPIFVVNGPASFAVREGGIAEVEVIREGKANVAASVTVVLENLSATAGEDYLGLPVTLAFASGETLRTAHIPTYSDGDNEGPENVRVRLVNPSSKAILGRNDRGEIFIDDAQDDPANDLFADAEVLNGLDNFATGDSTGAGTESGEIPTSVGLDGYSSYSRTVWYYWTPGSSGLAELRITGFATDGGQFTLGVGTGSGLSDLAPSISGQQIYDGNTDEQRRIFNVTVGETYWIMVTAPGSDGGPFTLKYKLLQAGAFELVPGQTFREDDGTATVRVRRVGGSDGSVTVNYETAIPEGFPPEADPGSDYTGVSNMLTFADGETEQTFTIDLTADDVAEGTERLPIYLSTPTGGAAILAEFRNIYIDEEEDDPANDLFANAQAIAGGEGDLDGDNTGAGTEPDEPEGLRESIWYSWTVPTTGFAEIFGSAHLSVWRGTTLASLVEVASGDYGLAPFAVTAGETLRIAVSTLDSNEGQESSAAPFSLTWEISPLNLFHFSADTYTVAENGGSATIRIERDGPATKAASVWLETNDFIFGPGLAYATPGADYKKTRVKITLPAGHTFKDVLIPIFIDNEAEGTEIVGLILDDAGEGSTTGAPDFARLKILDSSVYSPKKAAFFGLISGTSLGESGYFTATSDAKGFLTGKLLLGGKAYSFKGPILADGSAHITIPRKGTPLPTPIVLNLQLGADFDTLAGTLIVDSATLGVSAHRSTFKKSDPAILAGRFTAILESDATPGSPDAPGFAVINVTAATGAVKMTGALADGTKFSWGTFLAPDGTIPVSILLYKLKGILHGELQLGDYTPEQDGGGSLHWIHPAQTKGQFQAAFESDLAVRISAYTFTKGVRALPVLDPGDTVINLFDTAADVDITTDINISAKSVVTIVDPASNVEKVTVKIATATGLLSGSFKHTDGKTVPITGVLYQRTAQGAGFFLGTTVNGTVEIDPL